MNKVKFVLFAAGISLALGFTFIGCSGDSPSGPSGGEPPPSPKPSSSSAYTPPPPPSSSVIVSSSSSVVVGTQYYDVTLGNWSTSCPSLNDYPNLLNNVISMNDDSRSFMQTCLINPEYYTQNTGSQVANFLATNGLSGYTNDFDSRIAASPYKSAYLIYVNTSNYFRILIISSSEPTYYYSRYGIKNSSSLEYESLIANGLTNQSFEDIRTIWSRIKQLDTDFLESSGKMSESDGRYILTQNDLSPRDIDDVIKKLNTRGNVILEFYPTGDATWKEMYYKIVVYIERE